MILYAFLFVCFVNNITIISSIISVKIQDNRSRPSCNEPSRSSSTTSGAGNTQDPRKKTSELKSIVDVMLSLHNLPAQMSSMFLTFQRSEWKLYIQIDIDPYVVFDFFFLFIQELLQWWQSPWRHLRNSWDADKCSYMTLLFTVCGCGESVLYHSLTLDKRRLVFTLDYCVLFV